MRLFVAITPPEDVIEHLDRFLDARREAGIGLRWVLSSHWHLTLAFCAAFPEHRVDDLDERLQRATHKRHPVTARLSGGGAFPNVARAKVLWLGLDADSTELSRMATGTRTAIAKAGGAVDGQRFRPHVTLARMPHTLEASRWVRLLDNYVGPTWTIASVDLMASYLGEGDRGRPRYERVATYPLHPAHSAN